MQETGREDDVTLEPGRTRSSRRAAQLNVLLRSGAWWNRQIVAEGVARTRRTQIALIYDGVLAYLLDIELVEMEKALGKQLGKKPKAMQLSMEIAARRRPEVSAERLEKAPRAAHAQDRRSRSSSRQRGGLLVVVRSCTVVAWYPITPSSSPAPGGSSSMPEYAGRGRQGERCHRAGRR